MYRAYRKLRRSMVDGSPLNAGFILAAPIAALLLVAATPGWLLLAAEQNTAGLPPDCVPVGVAKVDITPQVPVRMYGYAARTGDSEGVAGPLKAAALAIGDDSGDGPAVLLTVDCGAIPPELREELFGRLKAKAPLRAERFVLAHSHCHSGPDIKHMRFFSGQQREHLEQYARFLIDRLEKVVCDALAARRPGRLAWTRGAVGFAANRRVLKEGKWSGFGSTPGAPVDHTLPLLRVTDPDGKLLAVVINYACHATTLRGGFKQVHGDWPGCAQEFIEADNPGAVAMVTIGCGADADPSPHGTVELCQRHGRAIADEVKRLLGGQFKPVSGRIAARSKVLRIAYNPLPPMDELRQLATKSYPAASLLKRLEAGEKPPEAKEYMVTVWTFGDDLAMVFLADEVVVDYALRMKRQFDGDRLWINAYCHDVSHYIVSKRLIGEGGYEVNNSLSAAISYGRPESVEPPIEDRIVEHVGQLLPEGFRTPPPRPQPDGPPQPTAKPPFQTVDLKLGESRRVELAEGKHVTVKLVQMEHRRCTLRDAVRQARVLVEVDGQPLWLSSANYHLPVGVAGIQIDCPITKEYLTNSNREAWGLEADARLRLWPAGSPWFGPEPMTYPIRQRWFASSSQMANEPCYVDAGERPQNRKIYYHWGLDFGGCEALDEVVAATDGLVVSAGTERLPGYENTPVSPRYDVVYVLDRRGWYYRYSHLYVIDAAIRPGNQVRAGQRIGLLGKEGGSGGWAHLHFDIYCRQPSGKWGCQEAYAFAWEAYLRQYKPKVLAVARPHHVAYLGEKVLLDGSRSYSAAGKIAQFQWTFCDGSKAEGPQIERSYEKPGYYSEVLKVVDAAGNVDYDFAIVHVHDRQQPERFPPTIHVAYHPTFGIKPGDEVIFKARSFATADGEESWDFGDGSPTVKTRSDGNVVMLARDGYVVVKHRYDKPGHYLVRVERSDRFGHRAVGHVHVRVGLDD